MSAPGAPHTAPPAVPRRTPPSRVVEAPPKARLVPAAKRAFNNFRAHQMTDRAASLTYYAMLALFPTLVALVSLFGLVGSAETVTKFVDFLAEHGADRNTQRTIDDLMSGLVESSGGAAGVTFVISISIALNGASGAFSAAGRAINDVYNVEEDRSFVRHKAQDLAMTLILLLLGAVLVVALFLGGGIVEPIFGEIGLGSSAATVWGVVRWPVALVVALVAVALIYAFSPDLKPRRLAWLSPGALLFVVLWLVLSALFGIYVQNFGSYAAYGAFGAAVVLLLWLWISSCVFLFGAEVNAEVERQEIAGRGGPPFVTPPPTATASAPAGASTGPAGRGT